MADTPVTPTLHDSREAAVDAALDAGADPLDIEKATRGTTKVTQAAPSTVVSLEDAEAFDEATSPLFAQGDPVPTNPFDLQFTPSDSNVRAHAAIDATLVALSTGQNPSLAFSQAMVDGGLATSEQMADKAMADLERGYEDAVDIMSEDMPDFLVENAQFIADDMAASKAKLSKEDPLSKSRAYVRSLEGSVDLTDEEIDDIAAQHYMRTAIADVFDKEVSLFSGTADVLGLLALPDQSYNVSKLAEKYTDNPSAVSNYINSGDFVIQFSQALKQLPPVQRVLAFDNIRKELGDITDNEFKKIILLMDIAGETGTSQVQLDHALDKADAAGVTTLLGGRLFTSLKRLSSLRQLAKAGDSETLAKVTDIAMTTDNAAESLGVNRIDAASGLDPSADSLVEDVLTGAPEGMSTKLRDQFEIIDQFADDATNYVEEGLGLTDAERLGAAQSRVEVLNARPDISNAVGTPTHNGIEITYDVAGPRREFELTIPGTTAVEATVDAGSARKILTPIAGNRLSRGQEKKLKGTIRNLNFDIEKVSSNITALQNSLASKGFQLGRRTEVTKELEQESARAVKLEEQLHVAQKKLQASEDALEAVKDLDRLDQGAPLKTVQATGKVDAVAETKFTETLPGKSTKVTVTMPYTVDDVTGGFKTDVVNFLGEATRKIISPNMMAGKDKDRLAHSFERILFQSSKVKHNFSEAMRFATKGLSKTESSNVSKILEKGDDLDKEFTYKELVQDGIGGYKMSQKEYESYAMTRRVVRNAFVLKNQELRNTMQARNIKHVKIADNRYAGKINDTIQGATTAYRNSDSKFVYVSQPLGRKNHIIDKLEGDTLKEYYDQGYKLVHSADNNNLFGAGGTNTKWTLVRQTDITELPALILRQKPGYIPRVYKDAHFFVKQKRRMNIDGEVKQAGLKTLRYFDNAVDAEKYTEELRASAKLKDEAFDPDDYVMLSDREISKTELEEDSINMFGGLYSGARGEEALKYGLNGDKGQRVDALEALQNYVNHIGNKLPMSEYRTGIETRWINQAKKMGFLGDGYRGNFADARMIVEANASKGGSRTKLLAAHEQISYMTKVPTIGEQQFEGTIRSLGMALEKIDTPYFKGKNLSKYVYNLHHNNPVDAIRGATFHLMLGSFNFSQVLVQGLGATIAMTVNPKSASKAIPNMLGFSMLDNIKNPVARKAAIEKMRNIEGYEDMVNDYDLWKKSGLFESVVNSNADTGALYSGVNMDSSAFKRILEAGTLPFKMGELANMRISFGTALHKWKSLNKGKQPTEADLQGIIAKAEAFRLHMTQANKAEFQKGLAAVPFQFQQINTKFIEAMLGDELSKADKATMIAGQGVLFGAAGIPFGDSVMNTYNGLMGNDITNMTEEDIIQQRRGLIGWMMNDVLDINAVITGRVAIGQGVIQSWMDFAFNDEPLSKVLFGPTGNIYDRATTSLSKFMNAAHSTYHAEDLSIQDFGLLSKVLAESVAELPSSTKNLILAGDLMDGSPFRTTSEAPIMHQDENIQTIIFQALGFSNQDMADQWALLSSNQDRKKLLKHESKRVTQFYVSMMKYAGEGDEEQARAYELGIATVLSKYKNKEDQREILNEVKRMTSFRDANPQGKLVLENLKTIGSEFSDSASHLNPLILRASEDDR